MANYDINNPTDIAIMNALFDGYTEEDWDYYIKLAQAKKLEFKKIGQLFTARSKAKLSKFLR